MVNTLTAGKIWLLDGGFGTTLEDVFGKDISTPLWSASLVDNEPDTVVNAHLAFLHAGADVILTSTYQCAFETFRRARYTDADAARLMRKSVRLAAKARERFLMPDAKSNAAKREIKIALSLGPYGATLSPAQEFDGIYPPPYGPRGYTSDGENTNAFDVARDEATHALERVAGKALEDFHYQRLTTFVGADGSGSEGEGSVWPLIDAIAFETVPLAREVSAIRRAMGRLSPYLAARGFAPKPWWVSTVWPNGRSPQEMSPGGERLGAEDVVHALFSECGFDGKEKLESDGFPAPDGFGVNCTQIADLDAVVDKLRIAAENSRLGSKPFLVLYPNGGDTYDVVNHTWISTGANGGEPGVDQEVAKSRAAAVWSQHLAAAAKREYESGVWSGVVVGGCCKTDPKHIKMLEKALR